MKVRLTRSLGRGSLLGGLGSSSGRLGLRLLLLHLSNDAIHLRNLSLRAHVRSEALLGKSPRALGGVVSTSLQDLHDALLIRSPASDLADQRADLLRALA